MHELLFTIYRELIPLILQLIGGGLGILLMWAANTARTRWGIEIEARHREALHSALMSGIQSALQRGITGSEAVQAAVWHAANSVPDALLALKPGAGVLTSIAEAKYRDIVSFEPSFIGADFAAGAAAPHGSGR